MLSALRGWGVGDRKSVAVVFVVVWWGGVGGGYF